MREMLIETNLIKVTKAQGGKCWKFVSPGTAGVPDRICLFPGGRVVFVETKATGKKARPLQEKRHNELRALGFTVLVIDSKEQIHEISAT